MQTGRLLFRSYPQLNYHLLVLRPSPAPAPPGDLGESRTLLRAISNFCPLTTVFHTINNHRKMGGFQSRQATKSIARPTFCTLFDQSYRNEATSSLIRCMFHVTVNRICYRDSPTARSLVFISTGSSRYMLLGYGLRAYLRTRHFVSITRIQLLFIYYDSFRSYPSTCK